MLLPLMGTRPVVTGLTSEFFFFFFLISVAMRLDPLDKSVFVLLFAVL